MASQSTATTRSTRRDRKSTSAPAESGVSFEVEERLRFETLIADLSSRFVNVPADRVDREIEDAQRAICECLELEHSSLWQTSESDPGELVLTHLYRDPDLLPPPERMASTEFFPWMQTRLMAREIVCVPRTADAPPEAARDMATWSQFGIKSALGIPLSSGGGAVFGVLSFDATRQERAWPEPLQKRLQLIGQVFANALDRKRAEQRLRDSEARLSLAAASANAGLWTLEPVSGQLWSTQKTNELFGLAPNEEMDLDRFLSLVHLEDRERLTQTILEAMQSGVESAIEYRVVRPDEEVRWIASRGRRQTGSDGGPDRLMGVSIDITQSKRVELELAELRERLQAESVYLREEIQVRGRFDEIVGQSKELKKIFARIEHVAPTDSTVLITGETGTGKELVARAIHNLSPRKHRVMVKVDCSALPGSLIENELFGREKGAYTGALTKQAGRFELANGSTLFLDEIGELPLELQSKLLRVVQDGQLERLGSPKTINVDVRVIAATNRDLAERVKDGSFREDLYYRLNVFPIHVPPLRERAEDIPLLAWAFVRELERKMGKRIESIPKRTIEMLQRYPWPGNVRELRNAVEQALIVTSGSRLDLQMLEPRQAAVAPTLKAVEHGHILSVLEKTGWRVKGPGGAAELLGMKPTTLYTTMQRLGIPPRNKKYDIPT
jgi:formate hydrogenlyase transcriptional activator